MGIRWHRYTPAQAAGRSHGQFVRQPAAVLLCTAMMCVASLAQEDTKPLREREAILRIELELKNGSVMRGYVDGKRMIEVFDKRIGDYRAADKQDDAGIRVWYSHDADGFTFVSVTEIENWKIYGKLAPQQQAELVDRIHAKQAASIKASERTRQQQLAAMERQQQHAQALLQSKQHEAETAAMNDREEEEPDYTGYPWLKKFPPHKKWSKEKKDAIYHQWLIIRVAVSKEDIEFYENFSQWETEYQQWQQEEELRKQKQAATQDTRGEHNHETDGAITPDTPSR